MRKLSYFLASVASAVAALASSAATARTAEPDAKLIGEPAGSATTIAVSESAKRQISDSGIREQCSFCQVASARAAEACFPRGHFSRTF